MRGDGSGGWEPVYALSVRAMHLWVRARFDLAVAGLGNIPVTGPFILAPNHVSHEDPLVMGVIAYWARRRLRAVAIAEIFSWPVVGRILRLTRQIPLDRSRAGEAFAAARRALALGEGLLLYPEGTIVAADRQAEARSGVGRLALGAGVPVVPVASWGLQPGRGWRLRAPAGVVIGPPVDLGPWAGASGRAAARAAADAVLDAIRAQLPQARELAAARSLRERS